MGNTSIIIENKVRTFGSRIPQLSNILVLEQEILDETGFAPRTVRVISPNRLNEKNEAKAIYFILFYFFLDAKCTLQVIVVLKKFVLLGLLYSKVAESTDLILFLLILLILFTFYFSCFVLFPVRGIYRSRRIVS